METQLLVILLIHKLKNLLIAILKALNFVGQFIFRAFFKKSF